MSEHMRCEGCGSNKVVGRTLDDVALCPLCAPGCTAGWLIEWYDGEWHDGGFVRQRPSWPDTERRRAVRLVRVAPASGEPSGAEAAVREAWRSVTDSLPRPGAYVLVGYRNRAGHWRVVRAVYAAARSVVCTCEFGGDCLCEMDDTGESWWPEGWYEIADNADEVSAWRIGGTVTHWMPLPTAPGAPEEGAGE